MMSTTLPTVDPQLFTTTELLTAAHQRLDDRGLRATGSAAHHEYVSDLEQRLRAAGVTDVWTEQVPMRRWVPHTWGLELREGRSSVDVPVASFVAYSGNTGPGGITARLSETPRAGTIGLVEVPLMSLTAEAFDALDWDAPLLPVHGADYDPGTPYSRAWLSQDTMRAELQRFEDAGAAALVIAVDLPAAAMNNGYLLYDGVFRNIPALFVDRETGQSIKTAQRQGTLAHLTLDAHVERTSTPNLIAVIPGATDELIAVQSHTDGTNALEDNGPEAIVAMASFLATVPTAELDRGVLILLTTGHFAIEEAWGLEHFIAQHRDDIVPRIAAAVCLEHLGALPSPTDGQLGIELPDYEFGCTFATPHRAIIDTMRRAMDNAQVTESRVLRPFVPDHTGNSPDGTTWPGDGGPFWHSAGLPSANFISGPDYLLNVEPVMQHIDVEAMRRQTIAFTEAVLELGTIPSGDLSARIDS